MLSFKCPKCKGELQEQFHQYDCLACSTAYPIIAGIPDFRVYPDPYISLEDDRAKGLHLFEQGQNLSFNELVDYYYSITPEVPADLARYYANHHAAGVTRGEGILARLAHYKIIAPSYTPNALLDLGCGTGGFLAAASTTCGALTGVDVAFRWLIVAKKRLEDLGCTNVNLVCACADYLPFEDEQFDLVVAENLIEHVKDAIGLFREIERIRAKSSGVLARTVNRFAFGPEPHVGVWGVGYLPRQYMNSYVKLLKGIPYEHIHLQGVSSLKELLRTAGSADLKTNRAHLMRLDYQHHSRGKQLLFETFNRIASNAPIIEPLMAQIGPYLDITTSQPLRNEIHQQPEAQLAAR